MGSMRFVTARTIPDPLHSEEEDRFVRMGESQGLKLLVVVFTEPKDKIRIISAQGSEPPREEGS